MSRMYDIIQELCRRDGTDVTKMCRALKIPRSTLSELASGRTKQLTLKHARPIAEYFGVTIAQLAGDEPLETEPDRSMRRPYLHSARLAGINPPRFESTAEVRTALIHEDGHFASGAFYLPYSPYQLKAQAEYRAATAAVLKHIPYPELAARLRRGDTLADAAEYFCVTEDFLRKAYDLYRDMGYSFGAEEKA